MAEPGCLLESDANPDPLGQFRSWYDEAVADQVPMPETMTLATCTSRGVPSARLVLLRGFDQKGFVFFTNFNSRKARELLENPQAALVLNWQPLLRQVRIEGPVELATPAEADAYFKTRPRGNQLSAWASPQSQPIPSREYLEERMRQLEAQFPGEVPRPPHWGGYRVVPQLIEFWQGGESRLHDRLLYRLTSAGWVRERLAP